MSTVSDTREAWYSARGIKSWTVSEQLWQKAEPLVPVRKREPKRKYQRKAGVGRKPKDARRVFEAIVYVLRTGCQWKALPKEFDGASAVHAKFQERQKAGFFVALWKAGLAEYDGMDGIAWERQSIDGALGKAPLAQECVGANPTDRGKKGRKRSLLVDARGVPLSLVVSGANRHDVELLPATLDAILVRRPKTVHPHLCADAGYKGQPAHDAIVARGYRTPYKTTPRRSRRSRRKTTSRTALGRRTLSFMVQPLSQAPSQLRKSAASYVGLFSLAAALICWRQSIFIYR